MSRTFAAWARTGLASGAGSAASPVAPAVGSLRLVARMRASINGAAAPAIDVTVLGPGEVTGIDPAQVIRTDPHAGAEGVEVTRFASLELRRADLPWLFTPLANSSRLRPWMSLVVVPVTACTLTPHENRLPVLSVDQRQLPPITDAWAWAHVQLPTDVTAISDGAPVPSGARARLLCPRQLQRFTRYLAALVPNYEAGRRSGMELDPTGQLGDAWTGAAGDVELPVYHHWFFATGEGGDFESLARGLTALADPPAGLGIGRLDVGAPGPAVLASPGRTTELLGPVAAPDAALAPWPAVDAGALSTALVPPGAARVLGPPVYGALAAGADVAGPTGFPMAGARRWLGQLNLHPALRSAAGMGAAVVRRRQHDFVQEAWEQAGEIRAANLLLARARLGRRVSAAIDARHVAPRSAVDYLQLTGPVLGRVAHPEEPRTLAAHVRGSRLSVQAFGAAFRRLLRPTGPIARHGVDAAVTARMVTGVDEGKIVADRSATGRPGGMVTIGGVLDVLDGARVSDLQGATITGPTRVMPAEPGAAVIGVRLDRRFATGARIRVTDRTGLVGGTATIRLEPATRLPTRAALDQLDPERLSASALADMTGTVLVITDDGPLEATDAVRAGLADIVGAAEAVASKPATGVTTLATAARRAIDPSLTVAASVAHIVGRPDEPADPLEPVMVAPVIDEALWDDLEGMAADLFLPGADVLGSEQATILRTNPGFVAAFMVGANEEMMRELRWRGYPTDGRGTVFRRFWDRRDPDGHAVRDLLADVDAWQNDLGSAVAGTNGELVLIIRSELFRRYPGTVVTAVKSLAATPRRPDQQSPATAPAFHGTLPRGAAFFGFPITIGDAVGRVGDPTNPGWFIVFHQPATDLGFGIDDPQVETSGAPPPWLDAATLGADAAAVARATVQLPVRLAIHASDLVAR